MISTRQLCSRTRRCLALEGPAILVPLVLALGVSGCSPSPPPEIGGMFRAGPHHRGVYADAPADDYGLIRWSFQTDGPVRSSALVDSEFVFVGSGDGNFYAIDRNTGQERWRFAAGSPVHSSAAARGELVYFGDRSNAFYALDRRNGRLRWEVETGSDHPWDWGHEGWDYYTSSPVIVGDRVIVGSGDGHVYAFDARTGEELWRLATGGRVRSSPAADSSHAYVGSADGYLYALRLDTGGLAWRFETEGVSLSSAEFAFDRKTIQSSPALAGETVFFGSRDGKFYAVQKGSGELIWRYDHGAPWVVASPAVADGAVIAASSDGLYLHALNAANGEELWRYVTGNRVFSSPAISGGAVYVGNHSGRFMALDATSGNLRWEHRLGAGIMSSPVLYNGYTYVGSDDGTLYAIRLIDDAPPRRAVYWDAERENWNTQASHEEIRDHFSSYGYTVVDRFQLAEFMRAAAGEGLMRSVVVFAMDDLPATVAPVAADTVLARRYLDAGGKIVWLGLPPLVLERDSLGGVAGFDRARPGALLSVDHASYDVAQYGARSTAEGRLWGLGDWWMSVLGVDTAEVTTALALDENGGASAWARSYGGPEGSGFVFVWGTYLPLSRAMYEPILRAAEYGIGREPKRASLR